ncbi:hypothetical protein JOJ88_002343 [Pantoea cypripedii]|nr:hypothetical protein [Pantoea cypripedii]
MGVARYDITYSQSMVDPWKTLRMGKFIKWRIRTGRPYQERQSIALAMMMTLARRFEAMQNTFPINLVTDSGFSGEDLCSDLLGFYRVMSIRNPFPLLRPSAKRRHSNVGIIMAKSVPGKMRLFSRCCSLTRSDFPELNLT